MSPKQHSNSTPKEPKPHVRLVMFQLGVLNRDVQEHLGLGPNTLVKALDPARCGDVGHDLTVKIRADVEKRLRDKGWTGDAKDLWEEFDQAILGADEKAAA